MIQQLRGYTRTLCKPSISALETKIYINININNNIVNQIPNER